MSILPGHWPRCVTTVALAFLVGLVAINAAAEVESKNPSALAFDRSGNLFIADASAGTIFKIAPDGKKSVFAANIKLADGCGLSFDSAGNLFVLSPSGEYQVGGKVLKFAPDGTKSTFASDAGLPYSIAIDATGNIFVSDWDTGSIFKFTPDGSKSTFATVGEVGSALVVDRSGNLFAADRLKNTIVKFDSGGATKPFATGIQANALAADQSGNLFAADNENRIFKFAPDGAKTEVARLESAARTIALDPSGNLIAGEQTTGTIKKVTATGEKSVLLAGQTTAAPEEPEQGEDSADALPPNYAKHYLVAQSTLSPDKKFAVIYPTADDSEFPEGKNYIVSLKPFAILTRLETKRIYFKNESNSGLSAEWSDGDSVTMITIDSKWGPGDVFLVELKDGKITRTTNVLAKAHDLLLPEYRKAKSGRYNDYYDFIFESEDTPAFHLEGSKAVQIDAAATTDPKQADEGRVWDGRIKAVWDIAQGKFTSQKVTTEFAGVRKHDEEE